VKLLAANTDLVQTIEDEFDEMPGLRLTEAQFRRLWALTPIDCECVTRMLVESRVLTRDADGQFCLPETGLALD
jgi:hypothetical protein